MRHCGKTVLSVVGLAVRALGQTAPSVTPASQVPDYATYEVFFRQVASLEDLAAMWVSQGKIGAEPRGYIEAHAHLTPTEAAAVKSVSLDCRSQVTATANTAGPLIDSARSQAASLGTPTAATLAQLHSLEIQREQIVNSHIQQLQQALGANRYQVLDAHVRQTLSMKGFVVNLPSATQAGK